MADITLDYSYTLRKNASGNKSTDFVRQPGKIKIPSGMITAITVVCKVNENVSPFPCKILQLVYSNNQDGRIIDRPLYIDKDQADANGITI